MEIQMHLDRIAETLFKYIPSMTSREQMISLNLYKCLAQGKAVTSADLAERAAISIEEAESFIKNRFGVYRDKDGRVVGYLGLAISQMGYDFNVNGRRLYNWCAWDSLFIPPLLGQAADVRSTDPNTGRGVEIAVAADGVAKSNSGDIVMSVLIPQVSEEEFAAGLAKDIISSFCHHVYFFESTESAREFLALKEEQYVILTLAEAVELSQMWNEHVHGQAVTKRAANRQRG